MRLKAKIFLLGVIIGLLLALPWVVTGSTYQPYNNLPGIYYTGPRWGCHITTFANREYQPVTTLVVDCPGVDGSSETVTLTVENVGGEKRLYDMKNFYGDYMVIEGNGDLAYYDDNGFIYFVPQSS